MVVVEGTSEYLHICYVWICRFFGGYLCAPSLLSNFVKVPTDLLILLLFKSQFHCRALLADFMVGLMNTLYFL